MTKQTTEDLDGIRAEIDALDDGILDLLKKRVELVEKISAVKGNREGALAIRPGREAGILRRILVDYEGELPAVVVGRIWREMISAFCRLQAPYSVAVTAPEKSVGYWDMARYHYGSATSMTLHRSSQVVMSAVADNPKVIGILPWPISNDEDAPWWMPLAVRGEGAPKIIARLPFLDDHTGRFEDLSALVVGCVEPEASGDDISLAVITAGEEVSRARLNGMLEQAGIPGQCIDSRPDKGGAGDWLHLIEVPEFLSSGDSRLAGLLENNKKTISRVLVLGAYARPMNLTPPA